MPLPLDAIFTLKNARKRLANLKDIVEGGGYFEVDRVSAQFDPGNPSIVKSDFPNPLKYISPEAGGYSG